MIDIFERVWQNLMERTTGPMNFRLFLQPAMAVFFAIRAALRDVKKNEVPYLWRLTTTVKGDRKAILKEGWKDFGKVFILATVLDIAYQLVVIFGMKTESSFYPLESIIVAFLLSFIPYIFFRGPVSRVVRYFAAKKS
jgi:predicted PurR-regulated permease PerM